MCGCRTWARHRAATSFTFHCHYGLGQDTRKTATVAANSYPAAMPAEDWQMAS